MAQYNFITAISVGNEMYCKVLVVNQVIDLRDKFIYVIDFISCVKSYDKYLLTTSATNRKKQSIDYTSLFGFDSSQIKVNAKLSCNSITIISLLNKCHVDCKYDYSVSVVW